eukprot:2649210-Alexandrium_andersonii.AAC.1
MSRERNGCEGARVGRAARRENPHASSLARDHVGGQASGQVAGCATLAFGIAGVLKHPGSHLL